MRESSRCGSRGEITTKRHFFDRLLSEAVVHSRPGLRLPAEAVSDMQEAAEAYLF